MIWSRDSEWNPCRYLTTKLENNDEKEKVSKQRTVKGRKDILNTTTCSSHLHPLRQPHHLLQCVAAHCVCCVVALRCVALRCVCCCVRSSLAHAPGDHLIHTQVLLFHHPFSPSSMNTPQPIRMTPQQLHSPSSLSPLSLLSPLFSFPLSFPLPLPYPVFHSPTTSGVHS